MGGRGEKFCHGSSRMPKSASANNTTRSEFVKKFQEREQDPEHSNNATHNKSKINCNANPFALMRIKATSTTAKIE